MQHCIGIHAVTIQFVVLYFTINNVRLEHGYLFEIDVPSSKVKIGVNSSVITAGR